MTVHPAYYYLEVDTLCSYDSIYWQREFFSVTGNYFNNYTTINGCDSIFELDLFMVPELDTFTIQPEIPHDSVAMYQTETYVVPHNEDVNYFWSVENGYVIYMISNDSAYIQWEYPGTGIIEVYALNQYGCISDTAKLSIGIGNTGIDGRDIYDAINVFPNPAKDQLYVETSKDKAYQVSIYNSMGQIVETLQFSERKTVLNVNDYASGLYYLHFRTSDVLISKKIRIVR
ncbi:MAG: hypothetical protein C0594_11695 [Marinilabiliales bacterium]|nr:MAG: hypothetical protein C0594_11695 [Marinilabiliales bacterium]